MIGNERESLLKRSGSNSDDKDFVQSRIFYQFWMFVNNVSFGIISSLVGKLFSDVIDNGHPGRANFYSTLGVSMYSVTSLLITPLAASLSDDIGRKPIFNLAIFVNLITGIWFGFYAKNWMFIVLVLAQGAGDNSFPVGYALLVDYVLANENTRTKVPNNDNPLLQRICIHFTVGIILQAVGLICGLILGPLLMEVSSIKIAMSMSGYMYAVFFLFDWPETRQTRKQFSFEVLHYSLRTQWATFSKVLVKSRPRVLGFVICSLQFATSVTLDAEFIQWSTPIKDQVWISQITVVASLIGSLWTCFAISHFKENHVIGAMCSLSAISCFGYLYLTKLACLFTLSFGFGIGCMPLLFALLTCEASRHHQGLAQGLVYFFLTVSMALPRIIKVITALITDNSTTIDTVIWVSMAGSLTLSALLMLKENSTSLDSPLVKRNTASV